ncbi:GTP-binding protein [Xylariaceae sp. FL0016]|nr:GTP-binding protein [Xylariaceae sp. FL0016]
MASIFTWEHEPPRVNSPWRSGLDGKRPQSERAASTGALVESEGQSDSDIEKLEAEPQDGPIEYKLHLLLRPRRTFAKMSTTMKVAGSQASKNGREYKTVKRPNLPLAASNQSKQNRLQHLTTQLLWRLQQSSPYHTNARSDLVIPKLPEHEEELAELEKPGKLIPGLEDSNGALYEIGVADDGTFVGLTKDEMDESMSTLKIMAASLGCRVEVQRMKAVGTCEWTKGSDPRNSEVHHADLWVAEALIMPVLETQGRAGDDDMETDLTPRRGASTTEQLRLSITGPTTSGKTTLLVALSTGSLDNGRGSSRLNLLRHRHEVASGRTSSVAQALIGYHNEMILSSNVDNINEWPDIHDRADGGRLVFVSDSAGHPRYQRTTLRAVVGWAPHWMLLCIAANEDPSAATGTHSLTGADGIVGSGINSMDLAIAHLDLCLKLEMPLVIVVTKTELAQKTSLKEKLNLVLTKVKATGRTPKLLTSPSKEAADITRIPEVYQKKARDEVIDPIRHSGDPLSIVPIVLTSAVTGMGIGLTHALLESLPVPPPPTARDFVPLALNPEQPAALFHIDEVFELTLSGAKISAGRRVDMSAPVVTGYMRFGKLSIGDKLVLGPFPGEDDEDARALIPNDHPSPAYGLSLPHPLSAEYARLSNRKGLSASKNEGEWHSITIVNIRVLRLPVQTITAGQAGSIQVVFNEYSENMSDGDTLFEKPKATSPKIRKGQVVAMPSRHMLETGVSLQASTGFIAVFKSSDIQSLKVNAMVNAYVGMVRAAVRILRVTREKSSTGPRKSGIEEDDDVFGVNDHLELERTKSEADLDTYDTEYHISLELLTNREWIELGARVVLLDGGIKEKSGIEGFVGKVIEVTE